MSRFSKGVLALLTSATMSLGTIQANPHIENVSQAIHTQANSLFTNEETKVRFQQLNIVTEQIRELVNWLSSQDALQKNDLNTLFIVNDVLDIVFSKLKQKYEKVIYSTYLSEFKAFSSARNTLKAKIKQLDERLNGIRVVKVKNLSLSETALNEITLAAKKQNTGGI